MDLSDRLLKSVSLRGASARAAHVHVRALAVPFKFVYALPFVHTLMPAQREREREKQERREMRDAAPCAIVIFWVFQKYTLDSGKDKEAGWNGGGFGGTGWKCEREGKGGYASREKAKESRSGRDRDWECQSSATSHPRNVLASATATKGEYKKKKKRNCKIDTIWLLEPSVLRLEQVRNKSAPIGNKTARAANVLLLNREISWNKSEMTCLWMRINNSEKRYW